jgi:lipopolysaccharide export system permease protein
MKILDRYLAQLFLSNLLTSAFGLAVVIALQAFLYESADGDYPFRQMVVYHLYGFPELLVRMASPGVMLATLLTLSGLNRTHELIAIYSIGVSLKRLVMTLVSITFVVCCILLVFQDRVLPPLYKERTLFYWREMRKKQDYYIDFRQDKVWYRSKNSIYNLKSFTRESKTIQGMNVYSFDSEFRLAELLSAKRGVYDDRKKTWSLEEGTVTIFSEDEGVPLTRKFQKKPLVIPEAPNDFVELAKETDALRIKSLWSLIERSKRTGKPSAVYETKFHTRISMSFTPLVMCLLAVPFVVRRQREGGLARDLSIGLAVTFFYWLFYSVSLSLGSNGALPPWLAAWLPSSIFVAVAVALIARPAR